MATEVIEVIYEDYLYKLTGNKGKSLFNKNNPWKLKFFVLKKYNEKPVLELFNKKPKNKNVQPKNKILLWPTYRVEKVTNTRNRAYVFEVTTPDNYLCLSADEQRNMDIFVFTLQCQIRLKDQIKEDCVIVQSENSEAQRRIGAKGTNCIFHVSPWGVTLALQATRSVLAQWPLKSIRFFEASGQGNFLLESGRVAPMGDGSYMFKMQQSDANRIYDLLDQHIVDNLGRLDPSRRGTTEEIEDFVKEAERLLSLTTIVPCLMSLPEMVQILKDNWNYEVDKTDTRPRPTVHVRQNGRLQHSDSLTSGEATPPPLPDRRRNEIPLSNVRQTPPSPLKSSSRKPTTTSLNNNFNAGTQEAPLRDRPPLPPPSNKSGATNPISIPRNFSEPSTRTSTGYFRMNSSTSNMSNTSGKFHSPVPVSPSALNWTPPPSFQEATAMSPIDNSRIEARDGYLTPRSSQEMAGTSLMDNSEMMTMTNSYILPSPKSQDTYDFNSLPRSSNSRKSEEHYMERRATFGARICRLKSVSCEELTSNGDVNVRKKKYSKDVNKNLEQYELAKPLEPFPNMQDYRGSMEYLNDIRQGSSDYYNIYGLKGKVDSSPAPRVSVVRRKFNKGAIQEGFLKRSVSNPNFLQIDSKEALINIRASAAAAKQPNLESQSRKHSKSLLNLLSDTFKRKSTRPTSSAKPENSRGWKSAPSSPQGTLTRVSSHPNIVIGVKGIHVTQRTRSFRKPKPKPEENNTENTENLPPSRRSDESISSHSTPIHFRSVSSPAYVNSPVVPPAKKPNMNKSPYINRKLPKENFV